jgi:hypothetical protein
MSRIPFRPEFVGYNIATDKQLMSGSAPFVYNYLPNDNNACIVAKSSFNTAQAAMYTPDPIVRSIPAASTIQSATMKIHENTIKDVCKPSFQIDTNTINYQSLGMPSPNFI